MAETAAPTEAKYPDKHLAHPKLSEDRGRHHPPQEQGGRVCHRHAQQGVLFPKSKVEAKSVGFHLGPIGPFWDP